MSREDGKRKKIRFLRLLTWIQVGGLLLSYLSTMVSPAEISWLYLFGMSYPFWISGTIIFGVFWLMRKSRFTLIPLIGILAGWSQHGRFIQVIPKRQEEPMAERSLKVMSYNVRLFDLYNWSNNTNTRDLIFQQLQDANADVICFQEFYRTDREGVFETRDTLLRLLPLQYTHEKYTHKMTGQQYFGVATFSRYPILSQGHVPFETDPNNFCIYSDILINRDTVRVYNAHLASIRFQREDYQFMDQGGENEDKIEGSKRILSRLTNAAINRSEQSERVAESIAASPYPVILCGDFNDIPISYTYRTFRQQLEDAFIEKGTGIGNTYIGSFPSFRIDYIMYSQELRALNFKVLSGKHSDHHAVTATLELPSE